MVGWKDKKGMELEQIKQIVEAPTVAKANRCLKEGWILLDMGVVQLGNQEVGMKGGGHYIFGRKKAI